MSDFDQRCQELLDFIVETLLDDPDAAPAFGDSLFKSQLLDSLALTMLVAHVEESHQIKVKPMDIVYENFDSIENMSNYVGSRASE